MGIPLIYFALRAGGTRRFKCECPVDIRSPAAGRRRHHNVPSPVAVPDIFLGSERLRQLSTAATRSPPSSCRRQQSARSPFRRTPKEADRSIRRVLAFATGLLYPILDYDEKQWDRV